MDLAEKTVSLMQKIIPPLVERPRRGLPAFFDLIDVITQATLKISGLPDNWK